LTLSELYRETLQKNGLSPSEIISLINFVFKISPQKFWAYKDSIKVGKILNIKFLYYIKKLKRGMPIAYIIRQKEFYSEKFFIGKGVLIPRPETELLVEKTLEIAESTSKVLDIGSGSGVIGIMISKKSGANVTLLENSKSAIKYLKKNATKHLSSGKYKILKRNLFPDKSENFDIIVSNPPYISQKDYKNLDKNVKAFEPKESLLGGNDGYYFIERIIKNTPAYFKERGTLFLEIGYDQKDRVEELMLQNGFSKIIFFKDLFGIFRVARGVYENSSR